MEGFSLLQSSDVLAGLAVEIAVFFFMAEAFWSRDFDLENWGSVLAFIIDWNQIN